MKIWLWLLVGVVSIIGALGATFPLWGGQVYYVPSGAMQPTLNINDRITASQSAYRNVEPTHGDIAIMDVPTSLLMGSGTAKTTIVKRVIGVPGDRLEIGNGILHINGKVQSEPYVSSKEGRYDLKIIKGVVYSREFYQGQWGEWAVKGFLSPDQTAISNAATQPIPANKYLVLGDNRGNSNDGHVFGLIDRKLFTGRVTMKIWPSLRRF